MVGSPRWRGAGEVRGGSRRKSSPWRARAEVLEVEHRTASCGGRGSHPFNGGYTLHGTSETGAPKLASTRYVSIALL